MPATSVNRKTIRAQLATLLVTKLQTTNDFVDGKLCRKVYAYLVSDFKDGLPVVCVSAAPVAGSERHVQKFQATDWEDNWLYLNLSTYVLYAGTGWTEAQAQDRQDDIEKAIADVLIDNRAVNGYWQTINYVRRTDTDIVKIDNVVYLFELIPIKLRLFL